MARRTKAETKLLNKLTCDCITYNLKESEALEYLKVQFGKSVSSAAYWSRRARLLSEGSTQIWLNHFTRIGFVSNHRSHLDTIQKLQEDSMRQLLVETIKQNRNEDKILKLKQDIRDNVKLLSELGLGTPIISAIKAKLEENAKTVQVSK